MKKILVIICFVMLIIFLTGLEFKVGGISDHQRLNSTSFIDSSGVMVVVTRSDIRLVSLSPTHTENLYEIGAQSTLVGVDDKSIYPIEVLEKKAFKINKEWDVRELIELNPDYVIIEPRQKESHRKLVATLESEGIIVVSILPESMEKFDDYIRELGIISHHLNEAIERLDLYNEQLENFQRLVAEADINQDKTIIIETSEKGYFIPSEEHMIFEAATIAGGNVLMKDTNLFTTIKDHEIKAGIEFMLQGNIDSYFSITGPGYNGATLISISQKDGFKDLQVLENNQVYNLSSILVGRYTFRYLDGIKEFHRLIYQEESVVKSFKNEALNEPLTRLSFAKLVYDFYGLPTYINEDSSYYEFPQFLHTYGGYKDVSFRHSWYDVIETVTMKGYIQPLKNIDDVEYYEESRLITKDELIMFLVMRLNIDKQDGVTMMNQVFPDTTNTYSNSDLLNLLEGIKGEEHYD